MNMEKSSRLSFVVTTQGHGEVIDKIIFNSFSDTDDKNFLSNAEAYCEMINSIKLKENKWINARSISENTPYSTDYFFPVLFTRLIPFLDDRSIQLLLMEKDSRVFIKALQNAKEEVIEKILYNLPENMQAIWKEDMKNQEPVSEQDIYKAREEILEVIIDLESRGEIVIGRLYSDDEEVDI